MKPSTKVIVAIGVGAALAACSTSDNARPVPNALATRITASDAVDQIAAARCQRDERCQDANEPTNYQRCSTNVKGDLDKSFGDDSNCKNGVAIDGLQRCVSKIRGKECGFRGDLTEGMQTSMACGPTQLCLR